MSVDGNDEQVFENRFREYSRNWKDQVMKNGAFATFNFKVDPNLNNHTLRLKAIDSGQMIQRIIIDWGGLKKSYIGPSYKLYDK